ncbi:MAG: exopolysaccharide biosynthesis polyprenyl glycosylphosphotransferase [Prevotella sp.]|jgi:exopolysaccharide biosynthesis polyprenyl glycosylphosphotransferase|nr:exopolysaccharide biosynthesis polyprenyl glycosylphosphotransferase [Prevotella sp.]
MGLILKRIFGYRGFRIIVPLLDLIFVYAANIVAFYIFKDDLDNFKLNYYAFRAVLPYMLIGYFIISQIFELDKPKDFTLFGIGYTVVLTILSLLFITMAISFLSREFAYPRSILLTAAVLQVIFISFWHLFASSMYFRLHKGRSVLVIGHEKSQALAFKLLESNGMWANIKHVCTPDHPCLYDFINECEVTFLTEDIEEEMKQQIIFYSIENNRTVFYQPKNSEILQFNSNFYQIDDSPVLDVRTLNLAQSNLALKRFIDLLLGGIALFVFFIPFVFVYLALKIRGGTAFYVQERVTRNNKVFKMYKFRTMIENAEALSGPVLAQETDKRITKFGRFLRATRLDEIPQIYNILIGEMSIVGPRPERPFFVEQFIEEIPEYNLRHRVKAGLTGLAQVQGKYNTSTRDKLKYDLLYINGYSLALDIKLIMQTLNILLRKRSTEGVKSFEELEEEIENLTRRIENND